MADRDLSMGPREGITYPVRVQYCGNCSMPIEYCEYYPEYDKCKQWLEKNLPTEFEKVKIDEEENAGGEEEKKRQKRGGKGMLKSKKKEDVPKLVQVSRAPRGKKKSVTVVSGLSTFDIDLKVAAKFFGTKFACGSSVTGDDEIVIQGDVKDDLFDIIPEKWPEIDEDSIEDLVENPQHSDFTKLRTMLISTHMQDLKDVTQDVHYENFRAQCISQISQHAMRERGKLKRDSMGNNSEVVITDTDRLLLQKDEEIRRMQDMLTQMQEKLKASDKKHDSIIDV